MKSRYDYYAESSVLDEDGQAYPDPLNVDFNKGKIEKIPIGAKITATQISKPWTIMEDYYKAEDMDDILLLENNIPYITYLRPGDNIYIPQGNDLTGFLDGATDTKS